MRAINFTYLLVVINFPLFADAGKFYIIWVTCVSTKRSQHGKNPETTKTLKWPRFSPYMQIAWKFVTKMHQKWHMFFPYMRNAVENVTRIAQNGRWGGRDKFTKMTHTFPLICILGQKSWPELPENDAYFSPYMHFGPEIVTRIDQNGGR